MMALRGGPNNSSNSKRNNTNMSKDIKKSSYYVWFLGAQEAKGLRGEEYVKPIVRHLIQKERDVEPFKVTLQVSHKGLKIIQNVTSTTKNGNTNGDIVKHFIPHHAVTCVVQESAPNDDIVSCILLIYNPITRCPVHVHCYRCDSVETASILRSQLQTLIDRPDNQQKFNEIESRLQAKGLLGGGHNRRVPAGGGSDGRSSSTRESESSSSSGGGGERIATLYDSLAAELREKLQGERGPILLPPRDYDTVHRQRGNLTGIELRRCRNLNIVGGGTATPTTPPGSSGGSSGIGSDDAPPSPAEHALRIKTEATRGPHHHHVPVESTRHRVHSTRYEQQRSSSDEEEDEWRESPAITAHHHHRHAGPPSWAPQRVAAVSPPPAAVSHDMSLPRPRRVPSFSTEQDSVSGRRRRDPELRQRSPSPMSPRERFQDAKEKFHALERERLDELQNVLERRRQETAAANVAAVITSSSIRQMTRRSTSEDETRGGIAAGRYRAVPTKTVDIDDDFGGDDEIQQLQQHGGRSRRSMYESTVEEERRHHSHELAREFKRKSYHQTTNGYQELAAHERYPGLDKDTARIQHHYEGSNARYRHSYAEPAAAETSGQQYYKQSQHRRLGPSHSNASSSVASTGRLNMAALHPY